MKQVIITTSWDDGHKLDVRLGALLRKYDIAATFYISPRDREFAQADLLTDEQIQGLSEHFEIGAHTMTHPRLNTVTDDVARDEIRGSKEYLERLTGKTVTSFCYPGGNYAPRNVATVRELGFTYARTVRRHSESLGRPLEGVTTVNAYNHYQDLGKIARFAGYRPGRTVRYFQWDRLAKAKFDSVMRQGGIFHLWGHSWEIDAHKDWRKLEEVLAYISGRANAQYVTNGELVDQAPKKVLVAAPYFPPNLGGQQYYASNIASGLAHDPKWDVVVATSGSRGMVPKVTREDGMTVYRLPYLFKISNTPYHPLWRFWLRAVIANERVDLVNAHEPVPVFADIAAKAAPELPVVVTYHMLSMKKGQPRIDWLIGLYESWLLPKTLRRADGIICGSDIIRDSFLGPYRDKSATVTPGVDADAFRPAKIRPADRLLFVGGLRKSEPHKGLRYLLEALTLIVRERPTVHLTVVGGGDGQREYEQMARALGVADHVTFLGWKPNNELQTRFHEASVFVLPSLNDSFPMVILEAMASGLPVVSTTAGGIPGMIDEGRTGYMVAPGDGRALAERIEYLLAHPDEAWTMGAQGRLKVEHHLTWSRQTRKTDEILSSVLRGGI